MLYALVMTALVAPLAAAGADLPPSYAVTATHPEYGPGIGYLWGDPELGAKLWLDLAGGYGYFGFSIGGSHATYATPAGDLVVDNWMRTTNGPERFIASYHVDANGDATGVAAGGGKLNQFTITVHGHT